MFVLEESQLLEDTIKDSHVLSLYKLLREHEHRNDRGPLIQILSSQLSTKLFEVTLDICKSNNTPVSEGRTSADDLKIPFDQRATISEKIGLDKSEVAPLALVVSAALTQLFVIDNFVGPIADEQGNDKLANLPQVYRDFCQHVDFRSLSVDGSDVYHLTRNAWLLKGAQLCWTLLTNLGCSRKLLELEFLVWKHRYMTTHLMILLEPAEAHIKELRNIGEYIFDHHVINEAKDNNTQLSRFDTVNLCCELAQTSLLYNGVAAARKVCDYISDHSGITIEHTGVLGKRTKFQQSDIPQLVVRVDQGSLHRHSSIDNPEALTELPKDIALDDDTLLPEISFVSDDSSAPYKVENLTVQAQLFMLTRLDLALKSEVMEESLRDEWTLAYLRSIIKSASLWAIKYKALHLRSVVEKKNMRKMDRALLQLEDLIKESTLLGQTQLKRLEGFYSTLPIPIWQMQRSLADISLDIGLVKNALDGYSKLEYWEGMIKCLCMLDQTVKAEKIIRQELQKQETPYLYCLLGDVTDSIEHYESSWLLSKKRFSRAKKSIGTYYYVRKDYSKAVEHYEDAHKANPSNISILSLLAYTCLTLELYDKAAEYYRNITYYDDANFLVWNNLSKAYIKLGQKERAWRTLKEAIKCNYDEWKIWENLMTVSMEIGALDDVVTAWHRIIDIKSSHKDDQVLSFLTFSLIKIPSQQFDEEHAKLLRDCLKLVARLISTSDCSSRTWLCYFRLLIKELDLSMIKTTKEPSEQLTKFDIDSRVSKITNCLQRATPTALTSDSEISQGADKVDKLLDLYEELLDCYGCTLDVIGFRKDLQRQWNYYKLSASNFMKTLEKKGYKKSQ